MLDLEMNYVKLGCGLLPSNMTNMFKMEDFHDPISSTFPQPCLRPTTHHPHTESIAGKKMHLLR